MCHTVADWGGREASPAVIVRAFSRWLCLLGIPGNQWVKNKQIEFIYIQFGKYNLILLATAQLSFAFVCLFVCFKYPSITGAHYGVQGFVHKGATFGTGCKQSPLFRW